MNIENCFNCSKRKSLSLPFLSPDPLLTMQINLFFQCAEFVMRKKARRKKLIVERPGYKRVFARWEERRGMRRKESKKEAQRWSWVLWWNGERSEREMTEDTSINGRWRSQLYELCKYSHFLFRMNSDSRKKNNLEWPEQKFIPKTDLRECW